MAKKRSGKSFLATDRPSQGSQPCSVSQVAISVLVTSPPKGTIAPNGITWEASMSPAPVVAVVMLAFTGATVRGPREEASPSGREPAAGRGAQPLVPSVRRAAPTISVQMGTDKAQFARSGIFVTLSAR